LEHFNEWNIHVSLAKVTKVIFTLPGTSAAPKHMFSLRMPGHLTEVEWRTANMMPIPGKKFNI
jgi:hypothetical protein